MAVEILSRIYPTHMAPLFMLTVVMARRLHSTCPYHLSFFYQGMSHF